MTAVLIIAVIGVVLAMLNRTRNEDPAAPEPVVKAKKDTTEPVDDLWSAFEAALQGGEAPDPRTASMNDRSRTTRGDHDPFHEGTHGEETDVRSGTPAFDTTVRDMEEGTVGFINESAVLHDDFGNLWLLAEAAVHGMPGLDRVGVSRQPEGWLLEQRSHTSAPLQGEDAVRVVGRFDIR